MKKIQKNKASALLVAIGLLAVLSAMAFTFATVTKVEMEAGIAVDNMVQTEMLDNWAAQSVIEKLKAEPLEGAMFTPVDWAGEGWYTRPLIERSPALPLGSVMSFAKQFPGKGNYTIDARVIDCSSQVNIAAVDYENQDSVDRAVRLLRHLPFGIRYEWPTADNQYLPQGGAYSELGENLAGELVNCIRRITTRGELLTKESLLQEIMLSNDFRSAAPLVPGVNSVEERIALCYLGKKDQAGNILTVGLKDFLTFNSWVDNRVLGSVMNRMQPRAPININTAPSWTLMGVFDGIRSNETIVTDTDAKDLTDYIVAYRTPKKYLPTDLKSKQDSLISWIDNLANSVPATSDFPYDATNASELQKHLIALAPLLINPTQTEFKDQLTKTGDPSDLPTDGYTRLPRPFSSWAQFDAFLKLLVYKNVLGADVASGRLKARAIMANCNPNTNYGGVGRGNTKQPARNSFVQWNCGKNNVTLGTTELCFGSYGRFEIEMIVGQTRTVHGSRSDQVRLGASNFITDTQFQDGTIPSDDSKFRTIKQGIYTPDRACFYNEDNELIMMRSILHKQDKRLRFAIPVNPDVAPEIAYWSVERIESVKKWATTIKFAEAVRLTTEADFLVTDETSGEGSGATFFPDARNKKAGLKSPSTFDYTAESLERDGAIGMRLDTPQETGHLTDTFSGGTTEGIARTASIYDGGTILSTGAWLAESPTGGAPLSYNFYDFFPKEPAKPKKGLPNSLDFTVSMWFSPSSDDFSGDIINCVVKGDFKTEVNLSVNDSQELEMRLSGVIEMPAGKKGTKQVPATILFEDANAIDVSSWVPGKWYWLGFTFQSSNNQNATAVQLFASTIDAADGTVDVVTRQKKTDSDMPMQLYREVKGNVDFGKIEGVVDDIIVRTSYSDDPEDIMPDGRFLSTTYVSPDITLNRYIFENDTIRKKMADSGVYYGTIAWTEHLTPKVYPDGDEYSDVYVRVQRGGSTLGSTAGKQPSTGGEWLPATQVPVWLAHDTLVASWNKFGRIGMTGDGQRIADNNSNSLHDWTGYNANGDRDRNESGTYDDKVNIIVEIKGPGDNPNPNSGGVRDNFETPYVDDVTLTFFPPYETLYWKQATETYE